MARIAVDLGEQGEKDLALPHLTTDGDDGAIPRSQCDCFGRVQDEPLDVFSRLGVSHGLFDAILRLSAIVEFVWLLISVVVSHNKGSIQTTTCYSSSLSPSDDYYFSFVYTCRFRGRFYLAAAVIVEATLSSLSSMFFAWNVDRTSKRFARTYINIRVLFGVSLTLLTMVIGALSGLTAQSTFVYTALSTCMLCFFPEIRPISLSAAAVIGLLAFFSAIVPIASIAFAPDHGQRMPSALLAGICYCLVYMIFLVTWWVVVEWRKLSYRLDFWVYWTAGTLFRWLVRIVLVVLFL